MLRSFALPAVLLALAPFHSSSRPLPSPVSSQLKAGGFWHKGCPVARSDLRLLTVSSVGFDGHSHAGQLIVNRAATGPLARSFRRLYELRFKIRHMAIADFYGPRRGRPRDGDVTASFECRQAVPSPCTGGRGTGTWSMHAFGLAVDINPVENPYVGCGQSRDRAGRRFRGDGYLDGAPLIAGRRLYVGSGSGRVFGVDLRSGRRVWRTRRGAPVPAPGGSGTMSGLAAAEHTLLVPALGRLTAYR